MGDLTGLKQVFNGEDGERSVEGGGCGLKGREAAEASSYQFLFERGLCGAVDYDGEGLGETGKGCEGDGGLGDDGMAQHAGQQGGWKQGQVNGEEQRAVGLGGGEGGADAAERAETERILDKRGEGGERGVAAGEGGGEASKAEGGKGVSGEGLAVEEELGFVSAHAAGAAAGQNETGGG